MDFERAKFEIIQKSSKKFQKITEETKNEILNDIETYNFSKIIDEIIKNILESKFDPKDINSMILVISKLHQIYDKFSDNFIESLKKYLNDSIVEYSKPSKNEDEEEKKLVRRKALTRLYIECYLYGIIQDFTQVKEIFGRIVSMKNTKEQFFQEFPMLVYIMDVFALRLFGIKPKKVQKLIDDGDLEDFTIETNNSKTFNDKYYKAFREFYTKKILVYLDEEHKILGDLEKKNEDSMTAANNNQNDNNAYQKERNFYIKYISLINIFAETMNFDIPELANEKTFRYDQKKKSEMKLEKINKYDPFSDEKEYTFYTQLLPLSQEDLNFYIQNLKFSKNSNTRDNSYMKKIDTYINTKILNCDTKEGADEISTDIIKNNYSYFNNPKARKYFISVLFQYSTSTGNKSFYFNSIKFYARLLANLSMLYSDFPQEITEVLKIDFFYYNSNTNKTQFLEEKIFNSKVISEIIKFNLFDYDVLFEILNYLIEDFKGHNIDIICNIFDNCGRFLYLNETSNGRFVPLIEKIKKLAHMLRDERSYNSIYNSLSICRPQEKALHKKVKVRPIEEEYIRFLIYKLLNKDNTTKIAMLLRKMNWDIYGDLIFKVVFKYLVRSNENQIKICCEMLSKLKEYHPIFIFNLINIMLEQIRIGLERNDFNDNQHKIQISMVVGYFYLNKIINSDILYYTMYMILLFNPEWSNGLKLLIADNPLDSPMDTFRILMIVTILEICGSKLNSSSIIAKQQRLDEFVHCFQVYILTKQYLPLDVENKVIHCLDQLGNYHIYNDFHSALRDSKNYKGLGFEINVNDEEINENKEETKDKEKEKKVKENEGGDANDDSDFKRNEELKEKELINIDDELQKIISDSLNKAKGTSGFNATVNPLADVKKKELNKLEPGKFRLFTKKDNKIVIQEVDRNKKEGTVEENEEEGEDDYDDDEEED